jgi:hypothetical protein
MLNQNNLKTDIVALNYGTGEWYPSTMAYAGVHPKNGCFLIWNEKTQQHDEYRANYAGTAEECAKMAKEWNKFNGAKSNG